MLSADKGKSFLSSPVLSLTAIFYDFWQFGGPPEENVDRTGRLLFICI